MLIGRLQGKTLVELELALNSVPGSGIAAAKAE
jgi:hypothetical protein